MNRHLFFLLCAAALPIGATAASADGNVVVNGEPLDAATQRALERAYGVPIQPGRYWYDSVSGVWGLEAGPAAGQISPGLKLGGTLRADASHGNTRVFINGRELHALDVQALQRCTPVIPGRYWVWANGVGGLEGGPPLFNLAQLCAPSGGRCESHAGGSFSCGTSGAGIGVTGEGGGKGTINWGGTVISTPN